jgi:hypothetical protein
VAWTTVPPVISRGEYALRWLAPANRSYFDI